jgi:ABC-type transport system involved in cytochrome c biogenesis permease subunit
VIVVALVAHFAEVTLYAVAYLLMTEKLGYGSIGGLPINNFYEYLYYSIITYTTLGIGDHYPQGYLRILSGSESLVGLVMITWSASFAYLAMQKFWDLHQSRWR